MGSVDITYIPVAEGYDHQASPAPGAGTVIVYPQGGGTGTGSGGGGVDRVSTPAGTRPAAPSDTGAPRPKVQITPAGGGTGGGGGGSSSQTIDMTPNGSGNYYSFNAPTSKSTFTYDIPYVNESDGSFTGGYVTYTDDFTPQYSNIPNGQPIDYVPYDGKLYQIDANTGEVVQIFEDSLYSDITPGTNITSSPDGQSIVFSTSTGMYKQTVGGTDSGGDGGSSGQWITQFHTPVFGYRGMLVRYDDIGYWEFGDFSSSDGKLNISRYDSDGNLISSSTTALDGLPMTVGVTHGDNWSQNYQYNTRGTDTWLIDYDMPLNATYPVVFLGHGTTENIDGKTLKFTINKEGGASPTLYCNLWFGGYDSIFDIPFSSVEGTPSGTYVLDLPYTGIQDVSFELGEEGVTRFEITNIEILKIGTDPSAQIVAVLPDGSIIVQTDTAILKYDKDGNLVSEYQSEGGKNIDKAIVADNGNIISSWSTATDSGVTILDSGGNEIVTTTLTDGRTIDNVIVEADGSILIQWHDTDTGTTGLTILDQFGNLLSDIVDNPDRITAIIEGADGVGYVVSGASDIFVEENPVFTRSPLSPTTKTNLPIPIANTTFIGIPADRFTGGTIEATVVNPPASNTAFTGIAAGVSIVGTARIVSGTVANTAFTGLAGIPIESVASPAANTAFTGIVAIITSFVSSPAANTDFTGIPFGSIVYDNLGVSSPSANTAFTGGNPIYPFIANILDGTIGRMIFFDNAANTTFTGVSPSSIEYATLVLSASVANTEFTGIPAIYYGVPRQIIFTQSAESEFTGIELPFFVMADNAMTTFSGISGDARVYTPLPPETVSDSFAVYDTAIASWVCPVAETVTATDSSWLQRILNATEYLNIGESLSARWDSTVSIDDSLLVLDTAQVIKFFRETINESLTATDALSPQLFLVISEYLDLRDGVSGLAKFDSSISDAIEATDNVVAYWLQSVSESLSATDTTTLQISVFISEYANIAESLDGVSKLNVAIAESITAIDSVLSVWLFNIAESLTGTDSVTLSRYVDIAEYLNVKDDLNVIAEYSLAISESVTAVDTAISAWFFDIVEEVGITDAVNAVNAIYEFVNDSVSMTEILSVLGSWNRGVEDILVASDAADIMFYLLADIEDALTVVDTVSLLTILGVIIEEALTATDDASRVAKSYLLIADNLDGTDTVSNLAQYRVAVQEMLSINLTIVIDGEVYECFVLNTAQFHPSVYTGFDFNSYCVFRNRAFGANSQGVYELSGDTDSGLDGAGGDRDIHTGLIFHDTDFGMPEKKKFRKAYMGVHGDTPVLVMDSDGERRAYHIDDKGMVDASRAVKGKTWTLSVADFESIESMKLIPVILARGN